MLSILYKKTIFTYVYYLIRWFSFWNNQNYSILIADKSFSINLYKEYTSLKSRELEELPRFRVMSRQPS